MIKKITNIRFSDSKFTIDNKKIELDSRRNRLLVETDWTQLPDMMLMSACRRLWKRWRRSVRNLSTQTHTLKEYEAELDRLEKERYKLPVEYEYEPQNLELYRRKLYATLDDLYHRKTRASFQPNLDMKYKEVLFFAHVHDVQFDTLDELIQILEDSDDFQLHSNYYPFIAMYRDQANRSWREAFIEVVKEQKNFESTCLLEEPYLIELRTAIAMAPTPDVMMMVEENILAHYGY